MTHHRAMPEATPAGYTACAGTLDVAGANGARGHIFYTAYLRPSPPGSPRPLAFIWNGGPGADSRLLQFGALGPMLISKGRYHANPDSPLAVADLVFVDPVGTGFSRADHGEDAGAFYTTLADIAATADFITRFRDATRRQAAPLYLIGESFGTWRAGGAAVRLIGHGVPVAGLVLVSGGIPLGDLPDRNRMRALALVNRAATALALGKLAASGSDGRAALLRQVRDFAERLYAPALADPAALNERERASLVQELARWQGLDPDAIPPDTLFVTPREFRQRLLAAEGRTLGIFDMRQSVPASGGAADARDAPSADDWLAIDWYRNHLGYAQGQYAGIEVPAQPVGRRWSYDQSPITAESLARAVAGEGPPSPSQPWILEAMQQAPALRTFVATGLYDSLNSCDANSATVAALPPAVARRFTLRCYAGGHMMYEDKNVAPAFNADISAFLTGRIDE